MLTMLLPDYLQKYYQQHNGFVLFGNGGAPLVTARRLLATAGGNPGGAWVYVSGGTFTKQLGESIYGSDNTTLKLTPGTVRRESGALPVPVFSLPGRIEV